MDLVSIERPAAGAPDGTLVLESDAGHWVPPELTPVAAEFVTRAVPARA